ncbi:hypothetical protein FRC07_009833, partial [Ceratobasidium sp. 392]
MSPWTVSAIFANVSSIWGRSSDSCDNLESGDVSVLLKEIDDILRHTSKLLKSHKALLPEEEYSEFLAQHRTYRWKFNDEQRNIEESSTPTESAESQDRTARLLNTLKIYRSTLLEASRQATVGSAPTFPDEEPETDFQSHSDCKDIPQTEQTTTPALA